MEFEDQEEHEEEIGHDTLGNSSRPNMSSPQGVDAPPPTAASRPRYKECQKNHAVGIGGHAVDGCGEFIAGGEEGTLDALKCAACNCHRNFHRKESDAAETLFPRQHTHLLAYHPHPHPPFSPYYRTPAGYLHMAAPQRALALPSSSGGGGGGGGCGGSHNRKDQEDVWSPGVGGLSKKRFRTKFSQEQKDKMLGLAERLGWKIQKQDESVIHQFCNDTGISRHVLKVWMHNNKHTLGKKP